MYVPDHFSVSDRDDIFNLVEAHAFGQLVSIHDGRPFASHLPFLVAKDRSAVLCHLARQNPQWQTLGEQPVLVTFQGPHDYVSPSWYQNPGVPTWNYQAVHFYGRCRVFEDDAGLAELVETLTDRYEAGFDEPWQPNYRPAMLKAIVGVEVVIDEVEAKYKLSQNRPAADRPGVVENLEQRGSGALAGAMRKHSLE